MRRGASPVGYSRLRLALAPVASADDGLWITSTARSRCSSIADLEGNIDVSSDGEFTIAARAGRSTLQGVVGTSIGELPDTRHPA